MGTPDTARIVLLIIAYRSKGAGCSPATDLEANRVDLLAVRQCITAGSCASSGQGRRMRNGSGIKNKTKDHKTQNEFAKLSTLD